MEPPEKGLIGSLDLEGVRRLRNAAALRGGLAPLAAIGSAIRFDLLLLPAAALPILQRYSLISVYRQSRQGGERSKAAGAQAVRRQTTVTRALRSARGCNMNRLAGTRGEATYTAPDSAGCAALQAASPQCRGSRGTPLVLLWGIQRGYSLREENTPFAWQWRSAPHYPCSASGAAPPRPPRGEIKGDTLFGKRINPCNIKVSQ